MYPLLWIYSERRADSHCRLALGPLQMGCCLFQVVTCGSSIQPGEGSGSLGLSLQVSGWQFQPCVHRGRKGVAQGQESSIFLEIPSAFCWFSIGWRVSQCSIAAPAAREERRQGFNRGGKQGKRGRRGELNQPQCLSPAPSKRHSQSSGDGCAHP